MDGRAVAQAIKLVTRGHDVMMVDSSPKRWSTGMIR